MQQSSHYQLRTVHLRQVLHTLPPMAPHPCAYLPGQIARDRGFAVTHLDAESWQIFLETGWRRAGGMIYQPVCPFCNKCTPLRIPVSEFKPNRSQRRTLKRNRDLTARIVNTRIDDERADLYRTYINQRHHGMMSGSRRELEQFLGMSPVNTFEIEIRQWTENEQSTPFESAPLKAVMVLDRCAKAWSAVYCYFDTSEPKRSIGTFAILNAIELCRKHGPAKENAHLYLGYWVPDSDEMGYKSNYHPHEIKPKNKTNWQRMD